MKNLVVVLSLIFAAVSYPARAVDLGTVSSVKTVLLAAIASPDGTASATVTGAYAEQFSKTTRSTAALRIEVTTIKSFTQPDCKRLSVRFRQPGVPTKNGGTVDFALPFEINLCADGSAPSEGIDIGRFTRAVKPALPQKGVLND